jgi:hypothetical protein
MKKFLVFLLLMFQISVFASTKWKVERAKVIESSYYGDEYYALIACKRDLVGIDTPTLLDKGEEILVEWRNTKEGREYRFYREID